MKILNIFLTLGTLLATCSNAVTALQPGKIIAIGDIHEDYNQFVKILKATKLVDQDDEKKWIGGNAILVQTGDIIHKGLGRENAVKVYNLLKVLSSESSKQSGRVISLLGNHELLELETPSIREFKEDGIIRKMLTNKYTYVALQIDGNIFAHGGISSGFWANILKQHWSKERDIGGHKVSGLDVETALKLIQQGKLPKELMRNYDQGFGPMNYRGFATSLDPTKQASCNELDKVLEVFNAKRMIMGHTTNRNGEIGRKCNNKSWTIDIGISSKFGGNCGALQITDSVNKIEPFYCKEGTVQEGGRGGGRGGRGRQDRQEQ